MQSSKAPTPGNTIPLASSSYLWLNQIELWLSTLTRRVLPLGNFAAIDDLAEKVGYFIDFYNQNEAQPYQWTYTGQPRAV